VRSGQINKQALALPLLQIPGNTRIGIKHNPGFHHTRLNVCPKPAGSL
jgi:hypothetical protein